MLVGMRTLTDTAARKTSDIEVRIVQPETDGIDWTCRYEIDWPDGRRAGEAAGLDSVPARNLVLQKIGIDRCMSASHARGEL